MQTGRISTTLSNRKQYYELPREAVSVSIYLIFLSRDNLLGMKCFCVLGRKQTGNQTFGWVRYLFIRTLLCAWDISLLKITHIFLCSLSPYCGGTCQILVSFKLSQFSTSRSSNQNIAHFWSQFFFIMISAILNFLRDQEIIVFLKLSHFIDSSEKLAGKNYFTETIMHFYL